MENLLAQSAVSYQALLSYKYIFTLGRKGKLKTISLKFPVDSYHHLAGFQYAGVVALQNRKEALNAILTGKVTAEMIYNKELCDRWKCICSLKANIENNMMVFKYRGHEQAWSRIRAEYLMVTSMQVLFVDDEKPVSIFTPEPPRTYERGCPQYKTLKIERINLHTQQLDVIFISPTYQPK